MPQKALAKTAWYPVVNKIAAYLGIKVTEDSVGKAVGKIIPLMGGLVSGGLTLATFKPMANKLHKELRATSILFSKTTTS